MKFSYIWIIVIVFIFSRKGSCCYLGWSFNEGYCYKIFDFKYDIRLARIFCQTAGGELGKALSKDKLRFFNTLPNFDGEKNYWLSENSSLPNVDPPSMEDCPYMTVLDIKYSMCSAEKEFLCEIKEPRTTYSCPQGWNLYSSTCLWLALTSTEKEKAANLCALQKGHLPIFDDVTKESYMKAMVIGKNGSFWVGAMKDGDRFSWDNEKEFKPTCQTCTNLSSGECLTIEASIEHPTLFKWTSSNCSSKAYILCETDATSKPTTTPITTPPEPSCPFGYNWKSYEQNGLCYWETTYETDRLNWYQARDFCRSYGGDLASYHDAVEEKFGLQGAFGHFRGLWLGLQRGLEDDIFRWSDGSVVNYTNWDINEPNLMSRTKFCVTHTALHSKWKLDYCGVRRWFVCKAPKVTIPAMPESNVNTMTRCSMGPWRDWYLYEGYCYLVHDDSLYTWNTAKHFCEDNGAHLLSAHSFDETNFVLFSGITRSDFWTGLTSRGIDSPYSWSDGTPVDFLYWQDGTGNAPKPVDACVSFNGTDGSWRVENCNRLLGVICKKAINTTHEFVKPSTVPQVPGYCSDGWYPSGNKCYKVFGKTFGEKLKWYNAKASCESLGASLASVHGSVDQEMLTDLLLAGGSEAWIGLQMLERNTLLEWINHEPVDYMNWGPGEPKSSGTESCISLSYDSDNMGRWATEPCTDRKDYICERPKDPNLSQPGMDPFHCENITEWKKLGERCYGFFVDEEIGWLDAQAKCKEYGANLASISNSGVSVFFQRKISQISNVMWIGIREARKGEYKLINGSPLRFTNWLSEQPHSVSRSLSNCVAINNQAYWMVRECTEKHPFICEYGSAQKAHVVNDAYTCPNTSQWQDFGGDYCYMIENSGWISWNTAMKKCFDKGGSLASIHSPKDVMAIVDSTKGVSGRVLHIGLGKRSDGSYGWVDHSPLDFTYWGPDEPDHPYYKCVIMYTSNGKWNDVDCEVPLGGYICSVPKVQVPGVHTIMALNGSRTEDKRVENSLQTGGIVGIILCLIVVLAIAAVTAYYLCPSTRMRPMLLEPETP